MHYKNSYEDDIEPNDEQIIQNEKDGHQTFIYKLLLARTGINPKKNSAIGEPVSYTHLTLPTILLV